MRRTLSGRLSEGPSARRAQARKQENAASRMGKRMSTVCDENRAKWQVQIAPGAGGGTGVSPVCRLHDSHGRDARANYAGNAVAGAITFSSARAGRVNA